MSPTINFASLAAGPSSETFEIKTASDPSMKGSAPFPPEIENPRPWCWSRIRVVKTLSILVRASKLALFSGAYDGDWKLEKF